MWQTVMHASLRSYRYKSTFAHDAAGTPLKAWRSQLSTHRVLTSLRCYSHHMAASSSNTMQTASVTLPNKDAQSQQLLSVAPM